MAASKKSNKLMNIGMIVAALVLVAAIAMIAVGLSGTNEKPAESTPAEETAASSNESKPATAEEKVEKAKENSKKSAEENAKESGKESGEGQANSSSQNTEGHQPGTNKAQNQNPGSKTDAKSNANTSSNSSSSSTNVPANPQQEQAAHTVTLSITCETILQNKADLKPAKANFVPKDGIILAPTTLTYKPGQTVFDVLKSTCREQSIQLEFTPKKAYIEGIGNLYEFDCGKQSGWMYKVNGVFPNYGCGDYVLKDNDVIVWCYTCKGLGADVGGSNG